jgi:hypothetical protein
MAGMTSARRIVATRRWRDVNGAIVGGGVAVVEECANAIPAGPALVRISFSVII